MCVLHAKGEGDDSLAGESLTVPCGSRPIDNVDLLELNLLIRSHSQGW